jgi:hypothetical protein
VTSTLDDTGNGTLRNVSECVDDGENVLFASALNNQILSVTGSQITASGVLKWMATSGSNIEIKSTGSNRILNIPAGNSAEVQYLKFTGGALANGSAISNSGTLILRDCDVHRSTGTGTALRNLGTMHIYGLCDIKF